MNEILSLRYCTSFPQRVAPLPILFLQASRHLWIILSSIIGLSARPLFERHSEIAAKPCSLSWPGRQSKCIVIISLLPSLPEERTDWSNYRRLFTSQISTSAGNSISPPDREPLLLRIVENKTSLVCRCRFIDVVITCHRIFIAIRWNIGFDTFVFTQKMRAITCSH